MGRDEEIFFVDYIRVIYKNQKERRIEEITKDEISNLHPAKRQKPSKSILYNPKPM